MHSNKLFQVNFEKNFSRKKEKTSKFNLRFIIAIRFSVGDKSEGQSQYSNIEKWKTITKYCEGYHISFVFRKKYFNQSQIQEDSLHQHPHEGNQVDVVEENGNNLTVDRNMTICIPRFVYPSNKD